MHRWRQICGLTVLSLGLMAAGLRGQKLPPELDKHLQAAQADFDQEKYAEAARELRAAIAIYPKIHGAYYQLGYCLFQLHETAASEQAFLKELQFEPPDPYSLYYLGTIKSEAGQTKLAVSYFEKSLQAGDVRDTRQKLAGGYLAQGRLDDAIHLLEESVKVRPEDGALHYQLGRAYKQKGRTADAKAEFDASARWKTKFRDGMISLAGLREALQAKNEPNAVARTNELLAANDCDLLLASATLLGQAGLHEEARSFLKKTIEVNPSIAEAHYDLARSYVASENRADAFPELQKAIELKPSFYEAQLLLGTLLADEGKTEEAIKYLKAAATERSDSPRLLEMLGLQYYQQNYFADAVECLKKAVSLEPANPDPRFLLIEAYYRNFEYEHALALAQETAARFPQIALAHFHLGAQLNNFGRLPEAKQQLDLALAKDAHLVEAQVMLGDVLFKMGKLDECLTSFRAALSTDPKLMDAHAGLGKALIQLRRYNEAADAMEQAVHIDPNPPAPHLYLSQAYRALGRADDAKREAAVFSKLNQERANARDRDSDRKYKN